jgi:hypothetical protein
MHKNQAIQRKEMNSQQMKPLIVIGLAVLALVGCSTAKLQAGITWMPEKDPQIRRLLKERYDAAVNAYEWEKNKAEMGKSTTEQVFHFARMVVDAEVELAQTPEQVIAARESQLKIAKQWEDETKRRVQVGSLPSGDQNMARYWRSTAEIELARAKRDCQTKR